LACRHIDLQIAVSNLYAYYSILKLSFSTGSHNRIEAIRYSTGPQPKTFLQREWNLKAERTVERKQSMKQLLSLPQ
jgi:hypothetical protein